MSNKLLYIISYYLLILTIDDNLLSTSSNISLVIGIVHKRDKIKIFESFSFKFEHFL